MIEFIPYILPIAVSVVIGSVSVFLYSRSGKFGLALIGIGFFLNAVPSIVSLALGGPYLAIRLMDQGYRPAEIAVFSSYLSLFNCAVGIVFVIVVIFGLVKLSEQQRNAGAGFST